MEETADSKWLEKFMGQIRDFIKDDDFELFSDDEKFIKFVLNKLCLCEEKKKSTVIKGPGKKMKCKITSNFFRLQGYNCYLLKPDNNYLNTSFDLCTKGLAYAENDSQELALAYDTRSLIFYTSKLINECLIDIERALEISKCPDYIKSELYLRKAMCLKILNKSQKLIKETFNNARNWIDSIQTHEDDYVTNKLKYKSNTKEYIINKINYEENNLLFDRSIYYEPIYDNSLFKLNKENPKFPGTSDAIKLVYNKKYGRHIIATRDIKPDETLMIHKPYVSILLKEQFRYKYCWHCKQQTWASIPCDKCGNIIFCSIDCKNESIKSYHDYECYVLNGLLGYNVDTSFLIDLQLIIKGLKETSCSFVKFKNIIENIDNEPPSLKRGYNNDILDPTKFTTIYSMTSNLKRDKTIRCYYLANNILIAYLIVTNTDFIGESMDTNLRILNDDSRFLFLIKVLLKNAYITDANGHELIALKDNNEIPIIQTIIPLGFTNHSCYQMITKIFNNGYVIVKSLIPIKKNEQIFDIYGPNCFKNKIEQRKNYLLKNYNFNCNCIACNNQWPIKYIDQEIPKNLQKKI